MKKIKVVIAEDFQCYVEGYLAVLNLIPNVQVTKIFKDGQELIDYSRKNKRKLTTEREGKKQTDKFKHRLKAEKDSNNN